MRVQCVGAVVRDDHGRVLVVRRGQAPAKNRWSLPGGRVGAGESLTDAVKREVAEETGLLVDVGQVVGAVEIPAGGDLVYDVTDYSATLIGNTGVLVAGDDAADVSWATREQLESLPTSPGLVDTLAAWGIWD